MKSGKLLAPNETIPDYVQVALRKHFPGCDPSNLSIRYYSSVEDVGYDYFMKRVVPDAMTPSLVHYLAPFISFVRLGEALILDQDVLIVYEANGGDRCTETGPFWAVFPKANASLL